MEIKNLREEHGKKEKVSKPKVQKDLKGTIKVMFRRFIERAKLPTFRLHLLKAITLLLCFTLLSSVYLLHVVYAEDFIAFNGLTTTANLRRDVPRGVIFDRNMEPLVTNASVNVITYRHIPNTPTRVMLETAESLVELIEMDYSELSERDLQDLFIMLNERYVRELIPAEDRVGLTNSELHALMVEEVTDEHIATLTSRDKAIYAVFVRMNQGAGMTTNIIKEDATDDEVARVSEHRMHLPGIDVGVDWVREYPSDMGQNPMFGTVTNHQQGIPLERQNYFLSQGYAPNARVGTSNIEQSYQSYLSGFQSQYFLDEGVAPLLLAEGMPGFQVSLTIDSELQVMIEEIVGDALLRARRAGGPRRFVREIYVVLADPNTGEVLAMVGMVIVERDGRFELERNPMGTFQAASTPGSSIKGASLMVGYHTGATTVGQSRHDRPIRFIGSPPLRSWRDGGLGHVNDITAISESSNIYFVRQTMEMMGIHGFSDGMSVQGWDYGVWQIYREYFAQLGLGSSTGIDLQHESTGMLASRDFFNLLQLSFGQGDTYTAMQLVQFASVMATRGDRFQMQVIRDIYMPGSDMEHLQLVRPFEPNLLNTVELTDEQWNRLNQGHINTVQHRNGTAYAAFRGANYNPAGKTGTAEDFLRNSRGYLVRDSNGRETAVLNRTFVGYAPADNPQVAISVMVPQSQVAGTTIPENIATDIARQSLDAFFELQSSRERSNR